MDQRHPQQHPFSRTAGSPYSHPPFQSPSSQPPFPPPSSHPASAPPSYIPDHQRRPSDAQYYPPQSTYARDGAPMPGTGHSRHQSTSSIGHGTPVARAMPPPSSPQQRHEREPQHAQHPHTSHTYPPPSTSRGSLPSLGIPMTFPAGRDLPSLSTHRPGSSMSISSMLGGPGPASRDQPTPTAQYPAPASSTTSAPPPTSYNAPMHTSPQSSHNVPDYRQFRRPHTPEHQRAHELPGPRDHRANSDPRGNSAGSPPRPAGLTTPEEHRYSNSTPQTYQGRNPSNSQMPPLEERRDQYPVRVPNPNAAIPPPRPSSQPTSYSSSLGRLPEFSRLGPDSGRPDPTYGRPIYSEREEAYRDRVRAEEVAIRRDREQIEQEWLARDRQDRERMLERERMARERFERLDRIDRREPYGQPPVPQDSPQTSRQYPQPQSGPYGAPHDLRDPRDVHDPRDVRDPRDSRDLRDIRDSRDVRDPKDIRDPRDVREPRDGRDPRDIRDPRDVHDPRDSREGRDPRDPNPWMRPRHEDRVSEQISPQHSQPPATAGYDYPRTTAQPYSSQTSYAPQESRYPPTSYPQSGPPQARSSGPLQYDSPIQERQRMMASEQQQQQPSYQSTQPSSYRHHESPRQRAAEEQQQYQQRGYLGVQHEINRKGRTSPFPQAVQGAQSQHNGPGGEPGIKSEFGKMFSGIGSGVGGLGTPGPASNGAQTPFSNSGQLRRDDLDGMLAQDLSIDNSAHKIARSGSRGGKRRSRLKEEDSKGDDDSSTGRRTPSGRVPKGPKTHPHQMGTTNRHGLNRQDTGEPLTSPLQQTSSPFRPLGGPHAALPSPPSVENKIGVPHHHHINRHHHHHHHSGPHQHKPPPTPASLVIPKPRQIIRNKAVLDSVANKPRQHLGNSIYTSKITIGSPPSVKRQFHSDRGFASTPYPIPRFFENENCTFTIKVPRVHLSSKSREEITSRRAVWGTDIYTDDSDIIAACIHGGWMRGEWPADVDVSLLGLEISPSEPDPLVNGGALINGNKKSGRKSCANGKGIKDSDIILNEPPADGPKLPPDDHDLHVTVLVLPVLEKYSSTVRFGLSSREWKQKHDGLSFMILSIKWSGSVDPVDKATGRARRQRMKVETGPDDDQEEEFFNGVDANRVRISHGVAESNLRNDGNKGSLELSKLGTKSWWQKKVEKSNERSTEETVVAEPFKEMAE